ncbi:MAG TPA: hypothetical protein VHB20_14905 [Verrucomicrobiae bacterium]|jgi:hypothetical protein|nr:hypothetical protein [Verrucomicrobiae bacterium]
MPTEQPNVDWEKIKQCIIEIDRLSREFLYHAVMIGGAAAWFYRHQLAQAGDKDFTIAASKPDAEYQWLSRDIDFIGIAREEAFLLLSGNRILERGREHIEVAGVRIGVAQVGVTFDAEEVFHFAHAGAIDNGRVEFLIADPLSLYFEKCKLRERRGYAGDRQHAALLFEYNAYELASGAERLLTLQALPSEAKRILEFWKRVAGRAPELLQDERLINRLNPLLTGKEDHAIARHLASSGTR